MDKNRLEALSDGVLAIGIIIKVLEFEHRRQPIGRGWPVSTRRSGAIC